MTGWTGRMLRVDLSRGTVREERPDRALCEAWIGGRGLAGRILKDRAGLPFDHPDMPVLFFTGPLTATIAPTSGRACLMSRSPLTGLVNDASVGGKVGTQLKRAGYDGIVFTGRSPRPCGLEIRDGRAELVAAQELSGLETGRIFDRLSSFGGVLATGPAAESGVLFACVVADRHHAAGRGGLGLCLAAKNLKYVAVTGSGKVRVADPAGLKAAREEIFRLVAASPVLMGASGFSCFGTGSIFDLMDSRRMMPTDNFRRTRFEAAPQLNAHAYRERYRTKRRGCAGCHVLCKKISEDGRSMPEFETMSHFTALIGQTDLDLVVAANGLCNELGMDTISAGSTLACRREILGRDFAPGEVLRLLEDMGRGRGEGLDLGRGSRRYAEAMGRPELSMSVKGLELPAYDPRGAYGMALAYAVSGRGGCHLRAYPVSHEILRKPVATDRFTFSGKARIIKLAEDQNAVVDSLTACKFLFFAATLEEYARAYAAATGVSATAQDLLAAGGRICGAERAMNEANGFGPEADDLPPRFFVEPGDTGGEFEVPPLDREAFLEARRKYHAIRGSKKGDG